MIILQRNFNFHFAKDVEQCFMFLFAVYLSFLVICLSNSPPPPFLWHCLFSYYCIFEVLYYYIFWIQILSQIDDLQIFTLSLWFVFSVKYNSIFFFFFVGAVYCVLRTVYFNQQIFLMLVKFNSSNFIVWIMLLVLSLKNSSLPKPGSLCCLLEVLCFKFDRSVILFWFCLVLLVF